jgi:ethanolamine transporter EutH
MILSIGINVYLLKKYVHFYFSSVLRELFIIVVFCVIMSLCVWATTTVLSTFFTASYFSNTLSLCIGAAIGGGVYFILSIRQGIFFEVLGNRFSFLHRFKKKPQN